MFAFTPSGESNSTEIIIAWIGYDMISTIVEALPQREMRWNINMLCSLPEEFASSHHFLTAQFPLTAS